MKKFEIKGIISRNKEKLKFTRVVNAESEKLAAEKILSLFGSEHKLKRRAIELNEIMEVKE